jgi:hypothetical protein
MGRARLAIENRFDREDACLVSKVELQKRIGVKLPRKLFAVSKNGAQKKARTTFVQALLSLNHSRVSDRVEPFADRLEAEVDAVDRSDRGATILFLAIGV